MQTPCKTDSGRVARELFLWIPTLLVMAGFWIGCGEKTEEAPENSNEQAGPEANAKNINAPSPSSQTEAQPSIAEPVTQLVANPVAKPAAGASSLASHLPEKMTMLLSANLKQLLDKGGHKEFLKSDMVKEFMAEINDELAIAILKDPAASGLDIAQQAHVFLNVLPPAEDNEFGEPLVEGGLLMAVKNAAKLEKTINKIIAATGMPLQVAQAKGFKQVAMAGMPVALGFSDQVFVIVGTSDEAKVLQVPAMLEARINGNNKLDDSLSAHLKKKYDIGAWFELSQLTSIMEAAMGEDPLSDLMMDMYKDLTYSATASFDAGEVNADVTMSFGKENNQFAEMGGKGADSALLNLVPDNTIVAVAESGNMAAIRKFFNKDIMPLLLKNPEFEEVLAMMEQETGLTLEELLSIPKGDIILSWDSLEMAEGDFGPTPEVGFLFGLTVENWVAANKLINNEQLQQGMTMLKSTLGIQFAQNQKALFITSKKHANAVAEGKVANSVKGAKRAMLGKHVAGGFVRFAGIADVIEVMAEGDEDAEQAIKILRKFDEASFTSDMLSMKSNLTFKDKKTNALKQIVDLSVELAEMAGEFGIGNDF
ncbi:MAG: DUF4836 family protein, partial [Verrucomicrobiota bacterium]|nr:DUF4836 family protein [Verrucomicrobiota bacterium]